MSDIPENAQEIINEISSLDSGRGDLTNQYKFLDVLMGNGKNFGLNVALGNIDGYESVFKFGRNSGVGSSEEVIWDAGGTYTFLDTAEYINVASSSALDIDEGTGAWTLIMYGLDADFNEQSETIVLNGTTPVQSENKYLRLFRAFIITGGTITPISGANQGNIIFTSVTTSTVQAQITANEGQTLMAVYTVPAGKTCYVTGAFFSIGEGKDCVFRGKFRNCTTPNCVFSNKFTVELYENAIQPLFEIPLEIPEKTDMLITGQNGATTVSASASWGMILVDN